jgi:hypothetical protein
MPAAAREVLEVVRDTSGAVEVGERADDDVGLDELVQARECARQVSGDSPRIPCVNTQQC